MAQTSLLVICTTAFVTVFLVLAALALLIRVVLVLFPERENGPDAAVTAALTATVHALHPGARVTRIEELK